MRALGIAVDMSAQKRPTVRAVLLEDSLHVSERPQLADISVVTTFEVPSSSEDLATQLKELAEAVSGRVRSLEPNIVVVRRADKPPRATNQDGPRFRLMAEGAVAAAARGLVARTVVRTGQECGSAYGSRKAAVDSDGQQLASGKLAPAASAALSGLVADRA